MSKAEEQATPEEKLLKVIQGGGNAAKPSPEEKMLSAVKEGKAQAESAPRQAPASAPAAPRPPSGAAVTPPAGAVAEPEKPKLRTAEKPAQAPQSAQARPAHPAGKNVPPKAAVLDIETAIEDSKTGNIAMESLDSGAKSSAPSPAAPMIGLGAVAVLARRGFSWKFNIASLNRILLLTALVMVAVAGREILANIRISRLDDVPPTKPPLDKQHDSGYALLGLSDVLKLFDTRDIFEPVDVGIVDKEKPDVGWVAYARKNLRLKGLSLVSGPNDPIVMEAFIRDNERRNTHFLRKGEKITVEGTEVTLEEIGSDYVVLTDGIRAVPIKGEKAAK